MTYWEEFTYDQETVLTLADKLKQEKQDVRKLNRLIAAYLRSSHEDVINATTGDKYREMKDLLKKCRDNDLDVSIQYDEIRKIGAKNKLSLCGHLIKRWDTCMNIECSCEVPRPTTTVNCGLIFCDKCRVANFKKNCVNLEESNIKSKRVIHGFFSFKPTQIDRIGENVLIQNMMMRSFFNVSHAINLKCANKNENVITYRYKVGNKYKKLPNVRGFSRKSRIRPDARVPADFSGIRAPDITKGTDFPFSIHLHWHWLSIPVGNVSKQGLINHCDAICKILKETKGYDMRVGFPESGAMVKKRSAFKYIAQRQAGYYDHGSKVVKYTNQKGKVSKIKYGYTFRDLFNFNQYFDHFYKLRKLIYMNRFVLSSPSSRRRSTNVTDNCQQSECPQCKGTLFYHNSEINEGKPIPMVDYG